jgi:hypothetical protein
VKSDARSDQLITVTGFFDEALPIKYRDLLAAALNQTCAFQLPGSIRDGWPLNTQHFGEKALGDRQCVLVTAVTQTMRIRDRPISPRSPWQNPYVERLIGTLRRECFTSGSMANGICDGS